MASEVVDYKGLGNEATKRYFERMDDKEGKKVLEEIIADIAKREQLNNEEIARVCQYANVKVFLRLYKATNDKTVEFEVAEPKNVIESYSGPLSEPKEDLSFDESYYIIEDKEDKEPEDETKTVDLKGLKELARKLKDERDGLEIKLMEKKPLILKILSSKLRRNNPKLVTYTAKTAGAPEEILKEASVKAGMEDVPSVDSIEKGSPLVDTNKGFLQKVAHYGKMKSRFLELEDKLEKLAGILGAAAKNPLKAFQAVGEIKNTKKKSDDIADKLKKKNDLTDMESLKDNFKKYKKENKKSKGGYL